MFQRQEVEVSWGHAPAASAPSEGQHCSSASAVDQLRWWLAELPLQQAEAVVLRDVIGLDAGEVPAISSVGVDTFEGCSLPDTSGCLGG